MRRLRWYDYITINIYWLGLTTLSQTNGLIQPLLVQKFVGPAQQGTAFGRLRLYTLMVALLVQALSGMLSDRSTLRWGRRRPFILIGTLLNIGCMVAIGASPTYWALFIAVLFSQMASNIAHGAEQGLIPDLVPEEQRGRFSGIKATLEVPIPLILVAFTVGPLISQGNIWGGIAVTNSILLLSMVITMFVPEKPLPRTWARPLDWKAFGQLVVMTLVFLLVILGMGEVVNKVGRLLHTIRSIPILTLVMGGTGLLAMTIAVIVGVWTCVYISLGKQAARRHPSFVWWVVNRLAFLIGTHNLSTFAVYFLQARLNLEGEAAAQPASRLMMMIGILILLSALPSGWLADRIGRKRLVALSGLTAAVGTGVLISTANLTVIYVGGCIVGAATGIFFTTNWALGTDLVPKEAAGQYLGISNLAGAGAGALGSYIGGPIADYFTQHVGQAPGMGYILIFAIYAGLFLLSSCVLIKVQETWQGKRK
ncbi:MAG TPA: MFS transporter [Chloroflexi bacterium]|nr:MFS transporter [Chloroflexota bacterium]